MRHTLSLLLMLPLLQQLVLLGQKLVVVGLASPSLSEALKKSSGSSLGVETLLQSFLVSGPRCAQNGSASPLRPDLYQLGGP